MTQLSDRHLEVFKLIVETHVETASPVGSSYLARKFELRVSPATVRNAMMELEELGLVRQPFSSAGRVPTNAGYRYYIDTMLRKEPLSAEEKEVIDDGLSGERQDLHKIVEAACRILGSLSNQLSIVVSPRLGGSILRSLELVRLARSKLLAVLTVDSGVVRTLVVSLAVDVDESDLRGVSRLLNERLCGLSLSEIRATYIERTQIPAGHVDQRMRTIIDSTRSVFDEEPDEVFLGGTSHMVSQPEFNSAERLQSILELIERRAPLVDLMRSVGTRSGMNVSIGEENVYKEVKDCSVIAFPYSSGGSAGVVGVLGPTRMAYWKVLSLVEYVGNRLGSSL